MLCQYGLFKPKPCPKLRFFLLSISTVALYGCNELLDALGRKILNNENWDALRGLWRSINHQARKPTMDAMIRLPMLS